MGVEFSTLSDKLRERVWELHQQGLNNRQIADRLGVSDRTVARIVKRRLEEERKRKETTDEHHDGKAEG